jgi:hypothetical protein
LVTLDELIHRTSRIPDFWVQPGDVGIGFVDSGSNYVHEMPGVRD